MEAGQGLTWRFPSPATMAMRRPLGDTRARVGHELTPRARHMLISPSFTT